jgi:hypothetical protein
MSRNATDELIGRYFRRRQLGLRLLSHCARTQTVKAWSGLTRDQLVTLRRRWAIAPEDRRRGPSPSSFEVFFRSATSSNRAALLAGLLQIAGALPQKRGKAAADRLPSLEHGELLCDTYELFREWEPAASIDLEQAVLLAIGVVEECSVKLDRCGPCGGAMLVDKLGVKAVICPYCRRRPKRNALASEIALHAAR